MSDQRLDAERLAMLLDGELSAEERERLMAEIAADPDAAAELALASAGLRDSSGAAPGSMGAIPASGRADGSTDDLGDSVSSLPTRVRGGGWRQWRPLLAAASMLVVAAIGAGIWQATRPSGLDATFGTIAGLRPAGAMPDDWSDPPWARTRGPGATAPMPAVSAMIGARMADLEVAARQAPGRVPSLAEAVSQLVRQVPGSGPARTRWDAAVAESARNAEWLVDGRAAVEPLIEPAPYELGAVLEGIRLALLAGDDAAVRRLAGRLTTVAERATLSQAASAEAARLATMLVGDATTARNRDERLRAVDAAFRALF